MSLPGMEPARTPGGRSQSLYRKYRPGSFDEAELVGQEHVSRTLRNAVRHERVAHAYLFCGPRGCGKTTSARVLAKAVNCEHPDLAQRPCNECPSCRTINEGRAVDIIEIDAASNRGIDDIRDLREKARFSPAQLRTKFYIIDEVHQLSKDASNALLKTLEEPPPHVAFILATTDPEKVLDTISSRCQTFVFHRIPVERTIERLRAVCTAEGLRADDAALAAIARAATGSLRDALGLLDQLSSFGEDGITVETVRQVLGAGSADQVIALVDAIAATDVAAGLRLIDGAVEDGADPRQFAAQLVEYLRALLHAAAAGAPARAARGDGADVAIAPAHREAFTLGEVAELVKRFSQVDYGIKNSAYGHLPLELCLVDAILARTAGAVTAPSVAAPEPAIPAPRPLPNRAPARPAPSEPPPPVAAEPRPERAPTPIRPAAPAPAPRAVEPEPVRPVAAVTPEEAAAVPAAAPAAPPAPNAASPTVTVTLEQVQEAWPRIRQSMKAVNRRIEALLASVDPHTVAGDALTIVATYDFHRNKLNEDDCRQALEEVIGQVLGGRFRVTCIGREEAGATAPPRTLAEAPAPPLAAPPTAARPAAPAPAPPDDDLPAIPWEDDEPAPAIPAAPAQRPTPAAPREEPRRAQAPNGASNGAVQASANGSGAHRAPASPPAEADEKYLNAVKNIFNAIEIKS